jgi:hypothetical protein
MEVDNSSREKFMAWLGLAMAVLGVVKAIQRLRALDKA